jgi:hypothetical protein
MVLQKLIIRVPRANPAFRGIARALASPLGLASGTPFIRLIINCKTIIAGWEEELRVQVPSGTDERAGVHFFARPFGTFRKV